MLSDQLKEETTIAHQQLEKSLIGRIKKIGSKEEYEQLLRLFYGFYRGLEDRINKAIDTEKLPDYDRRRKSSLLLDDLAVFNSKPPYSVPVHVDLPEIDDHLQAMGALYVLEGSTLGGKIIIKIIKEKLGLKNKMGLSFFRGYAEETWQKWESFKKALNVLPKNDPDVEKVERAALETFTKFSNWIDIYEQQSKI